MIRTVEPAAEVDQFARAIHDYEVDGAAILRDVITAEWRGVLAAGLERLMARQDSTSGEIAEPGKGRFFTALYSYLQIEEYRSFVFESGIAKLAAEIMRSQEVRFFYDQTFVKEPGTPTPTPWHHDTAYWPFSGRQLISFWVPLDPGTPETSVLSYVKGSHEWGAFYPVEPWSKEENEFANARSALEENPGPGATRDQPRTIADIRDHPENYEFCTWNVEPGDVLIHHKDTVHGASGNQSPTQRRRAVAFRFLGDDVRWDESRAQLFSRLRDIPDFPYPDHKTGDSITAPIFPLVWPRA